MIFSYVFSKMNDSIKNIKGGRRIFRVDNKVSKYFEY